MIQRIAFVLLFLPCVASAQECRPLNCDCASIPSTEWRNQCQTYLTQAPACETLNKKRNYCQVAGINASSLPLAVARLTHLTVDDLDQSLEKMRLLSWAVREENTTAVTLIDRGDVKGVLICQMLQDRLKEIVVCFYRVDTRYKF